MNFEIEHDTLTGTIRFRGEITLAEIDAVRLDMLERAVVRSPATQPADHLQSMELLFRRAREQGLLK